LHVSAVAKNPQTYEHVPPASWAQKVNAGFRASGTGQCCGADGGAWRRMRKPTWASAAGRQAPQSKAIAMTNAQASFELLALRQQKKLPAYFTVDRFSVTVESARDRDDQLVSRAHAVVEMTGGRCEDSQYRRRHGPVNALDSALRMDLGKSSSYLADLRLVDYKVRILTSGTEAGDPGYRGIGRWQASAGHRGVSENIVDASFEALTDSIIYKLIRPRNGLDLPRTRQRASLGEVAVAARRRRDLSRASSQSCEDRRGN